MIFVTQDTDIKLSDTGAQYIYFYDSKAPFHRTTLECMEHWEKEHTTESLAIDLEYFQNQSKRFNVSVIPTFIIFKDGKEWARIEGMFTDQIFKNTR